MALNDEELNKRRERREQLRRQRLRQQRKLMTGLIAAAVVLIGCGILIYAVTRPGGNRAERPNETNATETAAAPTETVPQTTASRETVIRLAAAGDLIVTDETLAAGQTVGGYDFTEVFMDVAPLLARADLTLLNFEGNFCGAPYGGSGASAPTELLTALANAGVDMLQTANSCSINNGLLGLSQTLGTIRSAGLEPVGTFADSQEFQKTGGYTVREVEGIRIAFVAFTKGMDNRGLPTGSEDCVNLLYTDYASTYQSVDGEGITRVLRAAAEEEPDLTVALLHWGSEFNDQISSTQEEIEKLLRAEGVDVILGTHPHYVQKMSLDPETGSFIAYSLGDFFGNAQRAGSDYSVVLELEITKDHSTGITRVTDYSWEPIFSQTTDAGLRVVRIQDAISAYESNYIQRISQADYEDMVYALSRIQARITGE